MNKFLKILLMIISFSCIIFLFTGSVFFKAPECERHERTIQMNKINIRQVEHCYARLLIAETLPGQPERVGYACGGVIGYNCTGWLFDGFDKYFFGEEIRTTTFIERLDPP